MNKRLLVATRNPHKAEEISAILGVRCWTLRDFPEAPEVKEDQETFAGNARLKAESLARWLQAGGGGRAELSGEWLVLADDSGLEVDALDGAPGVKSARFAALDSGQEGNASDADNNAKLLRLLEGVPPEGRTARFHCVMALARVSDPAHVEFFDGTCSGRIDSKAHGGGGFGYDPLFIPEGYEQSFAELGEEEKNKISHRARALAQLRERGN